jgi:hypothetical protein
MFGSSDNVVGFLHKKKKSDPPNFIRIMDCVTTDLYRAYTERVILCVFTKCILYY